MNRGAARRVPTLRSQPNLQNVATNDSPEVTPAVDFGRRFARLSAAMWFVLASWSGWRSALVDGAATSQAAADAVALEAVNQAAWLARLGEPECADLVADAGRRMARALAVPR